MDKTRVVNINTVRRYDVYIGRRGRGQDGYFGNPFRVATTSRETSLEMYEGWFLSRVDRDPEFRKRILGLRGKTLGCFCAPRPCHGDIIVKWLEQHSEE